MGADTVDGRIAIISEIGCAGKGAATIGGCGTLGVGDCSGLIIRCMFAREIG